MRNRVAKLFHSNHRVMPIISSRKESMILKSYILVKICHLKYNGKYTTDSEHQLKCIKVDYFNSIKCFPIKFYQHNDRTQTLNTLCCQPENYCKTVPAVNRSVWLPEFKTQKKGQSMARNTYDRGSAVACLQAGRNGMEEREQFYLGW